MAVETTYTNLRESLAAFLDQVADDQEVVIVRRRDARDVALIPAAELTSLMETAHLLRSPKNAQRLLTALRRAAAGTIKPQSVDELRKEVGLFPPTSSNRSDLWRGVKEAIRTGFLGRGLKEPRLRLRALESLEQQLERLFAGFRSNPAALLDIGKKEVIKKLTERKKMNGAERAVLNDIFSRLARP